MPIKVQPTAGSVIVVCIAAGLAACRSSRLDPELEDASPPAADAAAYSGSGGNRVSAGGALGGTGAGSRAENEGSGAGAGGRAGDRSDAALDPGESDAGEPLPHGKPDDVWSPLSIMAVVNPLDHGAVGDGTTDDLAALDATVKALPAAGGLVFLPAGKSFKKTNLLLITKDHVKFWAPNRQATFVQNVAGTRRRQSILCRNDGCGLFGLKLVSDARERFDALEDNQISADHGSMVEVVGCEIDGSAATGIMLYGSTEHYLQGNYIHHTWADHIHHTDAAHASWVWRNYIFNEEPSRGDDGVACVTYGPDRPRCKDMEWWNNAILHTAWGRGYSVIGGDDISIHDNFAIGVAGAGIIVASESSYDTSSSRDIRVENNVVYGCGHTIGHPGILVSGMNQGAEALSTLTFKDNVCVDNPNGAYRAEGNYTNVTNEGLRMVQAALPKAMPTRADVHVEDTMVLRTRDVSHVDAQFRAGLFRIHVRQAPRANGFEQRFEYVVTGTPADIDAFVAERSAASDYVSEKQIVDAVAYALVLTSKPVRISAPLSSVSFRDLRNEAAGKLAWLWKRVDDASY